MKKTPYQKYYDWWVGKWCKNASQEYENPELVLDVELVGPPSFVYGSVYLILNGNKKRRVITDAYSPRKTDVIALTVEELHEKYGTDPSA